VYWEQQVGLFATPPPLTSLAVGSKDGAAAGTTAYGTHLLLTPGTASPDWDIIAYGGAAAGGGQTGGPFLPLSGGTLTGSLLLAANPAAALEAATKQYVDGTVTQVNTGTGLSGGPITTTGTISMANTAVTPGTYQGLTINAQGQVTGATNQNYVTGGPYLPLAGGTLTGTLTVNQSITTAGGSAQVTISDRTGTTPTQWALYATGGILRLNNNSAGDVIYFNNSPSSNTQFVGHIMPRTDNAAWCGINSGFTNSWFAVSSYNYITATSDARNKHDVQELPNCLGLVESISPQRFKYSNTPEEYKDRNHWGFIAQDVKAVMEGSGHKFGGHWEDTEGMQSLSYNDLVAVLWKAVQELSAEVAALKESAR
jgi:hypothetical protein